MASVALTYDESCPLLCDQPVLESQAPRAKYTPVPKSQLAALCFIRLADPIAFTQLFPYVNEFISDLHIIDDPSKIGFYSGLVESTCAIFQLLSIYHWASLSDVIGRRPVIIAGTLGLGITTLLFGFSRSLAEALIFRGLAGSFSGNVAVFHSVLGEITDQTNQAVVFPIYGLFWPLGSIIGPLIGGAFSNPASRYPSLFDFELFRKFPYFLPCFVSAFLAFLSVAYAYYLLDETLPAKRHHKSEKVSYGTSLDHTPPPAENTPSGIFALLSFPIIRGLCASGCALSFIATAFDVVFVLFCYSPIHSGGLSFSASQIGFSLAGCGGISVLMQLFVMPTVLRRLETQTVYNFCMSIWPYTFLVMPFLNIIAWCGLDGSTGTVNSTATALLWIGISSVLFMSRIGSLGYSASMMLVKENAPSPSSLGATNGLVQLAMCLSRAFAPAFVSSAFALSIEHEILGGYFWVAVMVLISALGWFLAKTCNKT